MNNRKRQLIVNSICFCIVFMVALFAFTIYSGELNQTFTQIERENLKAYSKTLNQEVLAKIDNVKATLKVVASSFSVEDLSEDETARILEAAGLENDSFYMNYYSLATLDMNQFSDNDKELVNRLTNGEDVISDVEFNEKLESTTYFGIAVPVYQNDTVVGFVRALLPYEVLCTTSQTGFLRDQMSSYLVYKDGVNVVSKINIIDNLKKMSEDKDIFKKIKEDMNAGMSGVQTIKVDGYTMCISYFALPYNDWFVINEIDHNALSSYSGSLRFMSFLLFVSIASVALLAAMAFIHIYNVRERKLRMESERFLLLTNFTDTILCKYIYSDDVLLFTSNAMETLAIKDITIEKFIGSNEINKLFHPDDADLLLHRIEESKPDNQMQSMDIRIRCKNGEYAWFTAQFEVEFEKEKLEMIVAKLTNNAKTRKEMDDLKEKANFDSLTKLYRYPILKEKIIQHMKDKKEGVLCILDCDKFKDINDTYGHSVGDRCLALLAANMKDEVGSHNIVARYGGDEFVIFYQDEKDIACIEERIQRLLLRITEIIILEHPEIKLSNSAGIAFIKQDMDYKMLFETADQCLYEAKGKGIGSYVIKK